MIDAADEEPTRNERNNIVLGVNEEAIIYGANDLPAITVTVNEIVRVPECTELGASTQNGELIALNVDITTASDYLLQTRYVDPNRSSWLSWRHWRGIDSSGEYLENYPLGLTTCMAMDSIVPLDIPEGETSSGWWILDLTPGATAAEWKLDEEEGAWEWVIP